jgi:uncharacterized protein (DUF1330 family)
MKKGYWAVFYRSVSDPRRLAEYSALAIPAIEAGGGRVLGRGTAIRTFEGGDGGENQRTVIVEFASVAQAIACYESPAYRAAHTLLHGAVEREVRIVEGVE